MSASRLPVSRRLVAAVAVSGLAVGGLVVATTASAAGSCPTYIDVAGDAYLTGQPDPVFGADDDVDVLDVSHTVDAGVFSSVVHVKALADLPRFSADRFSTTFTVAGKVVVVQADRDGSDPTANATTDTGLLTVAGTASATPVKVVTDIKASTVTMQVAVPAFDTALGGSLSGKPFTGMTASAGQVVPRGASGRYVESDGASAPATASYLFGGSCSGDSGTAPTTTDSASSSPTPTPTPTPTATVTPDGLLVQPRKNCVQFTDPAGDASTNAVSDVAGDTDDDLDLINVVYRTTSTDLQAFVKETALGTGPSSAGGSVYGDHSFSTGYTIGGKVVMLTASKTGPATATVGGVASTALKATASFDLKHSNIVFSMPLAELAALTGTPIFGAAATALTATSRADSADGLPGGGVSDSAAPTTAAQKTYTVGDNTCFLPPAGKLFLDGLTGTYSDGAKVVGSLQDVDGADVAGATLSLAIPGLPTKQAVTDASGDAVFTFPVTVRAGTVKAVLSFAGNSAVGATVLSDSFVVALEKTVLKATGSKGAVTVALTDNDRTALGKHTVAFTVGNKVTKLTTNGKGQAVLKGLAKGTSVKVAFAAVPGFYSAAQAVSAKAL